MLDLWVKWGRNGEGILSARGLKRYASRINQANGDGEEEEMAVRSGRTAEPLLLHGW